MDPIRIEELHQRYATEWGRVTLSSFKNMLHTEFFIEEGTTNDRIIKFIFEALDGEGFFNFNDNRLNLREFKQIMSFFPARIDNPYGDLVTILFKILDQDNSGALDVKELEHFFRKIEEECPDYVSKAMMEKFDDSKDGLLQFDEFVEFIKLDTY